MQQQVLSRSAKGNDMQYTTCLPRGWNEPHLVAGDQEYQNLFTDTSTTDYKLPSNI